jgi:hypothetical protein
MSTISVILWVVGYAIAARAVEKLGRALGESRIAMLAWVPVANCWLLTVLAKRPWWWVALLFVPLVQLVVSYLLWHDIFRARARRGVYALGMFLPIVNLGLLWWLALEPGAVPGAVGATWRRVRRKKHERIESGDNNAPPSL